MKKILKVLLATATAVCALSALPACADGDGGEIKSELFGTFTYQETIGLGDSRLYITHSGDASPFGRDRLISTKYPLDSGLDSGNGTPVSYNMDQRLKLNRDYTYKYDYTVLLSNPGEWGGSFARLVVSITGTFDFRKSEREGVFNVLLSNPTGGTQTVYSMHVGSSFIYNWSMHSAPDSVTDYSYCDEYDKFVGSRMTVVDKNTKVLSDDVFYYDIMDYFLGFATY